MSYPLYTSRSAKRDIHAKPTASRVSGAAVGRCMSVFTIWFREAGLIHPRCCGFSGCISPASRNFKDDCCHSTHSCAADAACSGFRIDVSRRDTLAGNIPFCTITLADNIQFCTITLTGYIPFCTITLAGNIPFCTICTFLSNSCNSKRCV